MINRKKPTKKGHKGLKTNSLNKCPTLNISETKTVVILFFIACIIRMLLNYLVITAPTVAIDESLYTNIARSLAAGKGVTYRSQPIDYPYLFYPILLVPVYWLHRILGGDVYRYVQIFNTLLISSSAFPAYLLGNRFSKKHNAGIYTSLAVLLMPDMIMGGYEMSECVIWPLIMWLFYFGFLLLDGYKPLLNGLITAVITVLLYETKPGAITPGVVILFVHCISGIKSKRKANEIILPMGSFLLFLGIAVFISKLFTPEANTPIGLYEKQLSSWKAADSLVAAEGVFLTVFLFCFACGAIYSLMPLFHFHEFEPQQQRFMIALYVGIAALILGTAVFIVPYDWNGGLGNIPLHLRYCSFCIPICFLFCFETVTSKPKPYKAGITIILILFLILTLFPGVRIGYVPGESSYIDTITLAPYYTSRRVFGLFETVAMAGFVIYLIVLTRKRYYNVFNRFCVSFLLVFFIYNNTFAYINANPKIDSKVCSDAMELDTIIGRKECLGITQQYYDDIYSYGLESRLNVPMHQITSDQFYIEMFASGGIYRPFVPTNQPPNINSGSTPDTEYFVLGQTIAEHMELAHNLEIQKTKNKTYTFVHVPKGTQFLDTIIYGLDRNTLHMNKTGLLSVFDNTRNIDGSIILHIQASGNGRLKIGDCLVTVTPKLSSYDITIPFATTTAIVALDSDIRILTYSTEFSK